MVVLPKLPFRYAHIWHAFVIDIFFTIWKDHNFVLFSHSFLDIHVVMYPKAHIYNNVMMQIQVQTKKVMDPELIVLGFLVEPKNV